jgi:site-specific DNA-cytosine methylase
MSLSVLVACEYSGEVRDAFRKRGHMAMSCDLRPSERGQEWHFQGDVREPLTKIKWDLIIAFPPCEHLSCVGAAQWAEKQADGRQQAAVDFVKMIADADCDRIAIENPRGVLTSAWRHPDQVIQPYMFGDPWRKRTCLWLKGLPRLKPTNIVEPRGHWVDTGRQRHSGLEKGHRSPKIRARTFPGVAAAMAEQWG